MKKKFGVIAVALIVAIGGIFYAQYKVQIEAMSTEVLVEEVALPLNLLTGEVNKIQIEDENNVTLEKSKGVWFDPLEPEVTYNSELINEWITYFQTEESINVIRHVKDTTIYGITETSPKIVLYNIEGEYQTFHLGAVNEERTIRYIYSDETELIYCVSPTKSEVLLVDSSKLIDENIKMPNLEKTKSFVITMDNATLNLQKENEKWYLKDFYKDAYEVKAEVVLGLFDTLENLKREKIVGKVTEETTYGIDAPSLSITLANKYTIKFGEKADALWYFSENESPYVYAIKASDMKSFEQLKPLQIIHRNVYRPEAEEIDSIEMTNPQMVYTLKLQEETADAVEIDEETKSEEANNQEAISVEDKEQLKQEVAKEAADHNEADVVDEVLTTHIVGILNDKVLDREKTETLLSMIEDSVMIETVLQNPQIEQKTERKAEVNIVYHMKDGTNKNIELISYDTNYYILRIDGNIEFAANKEKITVLFSELGQIVKNTK
ncbi:DUF4340 domain-containing protein [Cellulosilyticum ruminicola]|uniref:DUF4340 domain-containing protein n=1 Tax=Cellulosilyticum ruminicola TaxID=425254 RepID=UPI0006D15790|nr:DUF4340 domain-containing protein [Cellulosilyticum ruminicola]